MGYSEPTQRRNAVCIEKFLAAQCSYEKKQLGIRINTISMVIGMMPNKIKEMIDECRAKLIHPYNSTVVS